MVNEILRNPRYAGMVSYSGKHRVAPATDRDGWSRVLFDDDGHPLLGSWEAIIDPMDWSQVQFELQLRRQKAGIPPGDHRPPVTGKYLLSGTLKCGKCGRGLVGHKGGKGQSRPYRCPPPAYGGCGGTSIAAEAAEQAVHEAVTAFLERLERIPSTIEPSSPAHLNTLRAQLEREISRKQELMHRWTEGIFTEIGLTEEDLYLLLAGINKKISRHQEQLAAAEAGDPQRTPEPTHLSFIELRRPAKKTINPSIERRHS